MEMSEKEFFQITPRSFNNKLIGFQRKREYEQQEEWERTRALGCLLISPNLKKGTKADPKKIWPLPWDKKTTANSEEAKAQFEKSMELWKKIDEKKLRKKENGII